MKLAKTNQNWQGVPAGTELIVLRDTVLVGRPAYDVLRRDGGKFELFGRVDASAIIPATVVDICEETAHGL